MPARQNNQKPDSKLVSALGLCCRLDERFNSYIRQHVHLYEFLGWIHMVIEMSKTGHIRRCSVLQEGNAPACNDEIHEYLVEARGEIDEQGVISVTRRYQSEFHSPHMQSPRDLSTII
ncbi:hypothetical protein J6590_010545 [Homalodisca vitripennis]|nr:hypothetical protein J6590_010545 [Homalodisca vitripennis]